MFVLDDFPYLVITFYVNFGTRLLGKSHSIDVSARDDGNPDLDIDRPLWVEV